VDSEYPSSIRNAGPASFRQSSTGLLERGGSVSHVTQQYELQDYTDVQTRSDRHNREARRESKLVEKRRWLDEQDEMKFSHSIQFNAVPDWSSHYIAYSNLKKL
jgi:hypothetical protein